MILGIDPGLSGAICALHINDVIKSKGFGQWSGQFNHLSVPLLKEDFGETGRNVIDGKRLSMVIRSLVPKQPGEPVGEIRAICVLEKVTSSPQMGVVSSFRFGESYGVVQGVLAALGVRRFNVTPQVWKGAAGLIGTSKKESIKKAEELLGIRGLKNDEADAAIMAWYGFRFLTTKPPADPIADLF